MKSYLFGLLVILSMNAFGQRENTLPGDCVRIGASGTCITQAEFNYLDGATANIQTQLDGKVGKTGDDSIAGTKTFTGKIVASTTANGNSPCPTVTTVQRDAIASPVAGDCVYNSTVGSLNIYDGSAWKSAGGGVNQWVTATPYLINDVVIESNKLYIALTNHTSGTFATDLAANRWQLLNAAINVSTDATGVLPMANGGTDKALTPVLGGVVYTDAGSMEVLAAGNSGQVLQSNGNAAPTWENASVLTENQSGGGSLLTEKIQAPNTQLTSTDANVYLLETGNKNILVNASFEHDTATTGWTISSGAAAEELTTRIDGVKSLKITMSAEALTVSQDSTRYASQFADGVDGLVGVWVKTSLSNIYVCARAAGASLVSSTFNRCVAVQNNSKWAWYQVPVVLGATSNGVEVASYNSSGVSVAVTGDVYIDDAIVGAFPVRQNVDSSRIAGESYFAGTANCLWSRTSTTIGAFTTDADCPGPTIVDGSMGSWQTTDSDLPRQTINNLPAGKYRAIFIFPASVGTTGNFSAFAINDGTTTCEGSYAETTTSLGVGIASCTFTYTSSGNRVFELYAATAASAINVNNSSVTPRASTKFILEYFGSGQIYTASCGANCVDTFSAKISSAGVVTAENVDWINGNCSVSTSTFTCTHNSGIFTVEPNCTIITDSAAGADATATKGGGSSSSQLVYATATASSGAAVAYAVEIICQKQGADFTATRNIIGSFNEVVTTPGISKPKTCYYAFGGASATLASPTNCTTGTCVETFDSCNAGSPPDFSATGTYTNVTFANGTFANNSYVHCSCEAYDTGTAHKDCVLYGDSGDQTWQASANGGVVINVYTTSAPGTAGNAYVTMKCEGQAP
jgi:hypothetical protein